MVSPWNTDSAYAHRNRFGIAGPIAVVGVIGALGVGNGKGGLGGSCPGGLTNAKGAYPDNIIAGSTDLQK